MHAEAERVHAEAEESADPDSDFNIFNYITPDLLATIESGEVVPSTFVRPLAQRLVPYTPLSPALMQERLRGHVYRIMEPYNGPISQTIRTGQQFWKAMMVEYRRQLALNRTPEEIREELSRRKSLYYIYTQGVIREPPRMNLVCASC